MFDVEEQDSEAATRKACVLDVALAPGSTRSLSPRLNTEGGLWFASKSMTMRVQLVCAIRGRVAWQSSLRKLGFAFTERDANRMTHTHLLVGET